ALTGFLIFCSIPTARPWSSISPIHSVSVEGECTPKKPLMLLNTELAKPLILLLSQESLLVIPFHRPDTRSPPTLLILLGRDLIPFTTESRSFFAASLPLLARLEPQVLTRLIAPAMVLAILEGK